MIADPTVTGRAIDYIDGELVGHTSYLNAREDDRVVEIGNTWLASRAWGTGANTEAKLLLMQHAFEDDDHNGR